MKTWLKTNIYANTIENYIPEVILKKISTWDSAEFSKAGTNWFPLGNQRAGQQPKQVEKKTNPQNNNNID